MKVTKNRSSFINTIFLIRILSNLTYIDRVEYFLIHLNTLQLYSRIYFNDQLSFTFNY